MKRRVEICETDGHRRIYEDTDVDEWRRRTVDYVFKCIQHNTGIRQDVLWMIGRRQYSLADDQPTIDAEQGIPLLQQLISGEQTTLIVGWPRSLRHHND